MNAATLLRELADTIEDHQLPAPIAVSLYGKPTVQVDVAGIGWWLSAMGVPEPSWEGNAGELLFAHWPPGAFDRHSFTLACVSTAAVGLAS